LPPRFKRPLQPAATPGFADRYRFATSPKSALAGVVATSRRGTGCTTPSATVLAVPASTPYDHRARGGGTDFVGWDGVGISLSAVVAQFTRFDRLARRCRCNRGYSGFACPASEALLVADYSLGNAAELSASVQLVAGQLVRQHVPLGLVSTNPSGALLLKQLLQSAIRDSAVTDYQYGLNYTNLGYLPGGLAGIHRF
jgi:hypothetical protein